MNPFREEALFALALEKQAEKRPAFLDAVCEVDSALRQRLDALHATHEQPETPAQAEAVRPTIKLDLADAPDEAVGHTPGRYKLLEQVGEGGCGVVYVEALISCVSWFIRITSGCDQSPTADRRMAMLAFSPSRGGSFMKFLGIRPLLVVGVTMQLVVIGTMSRATAAPANWPQFRGLEGAGVSVDAKPPTKLGPTESVLWSMEVPWSPSSPIVWGDRIFLTTLREGELETRCHARADGRMLWARGVKPEKIEEFHRSDGSPAASSPATDGHHVISYFGSFGLVCYDVDGNELWRHPMPAAVSAGQYGTGTSPLIVGQSVVLNRDQFRDSSLLALDLSTGTRLWETGRPDSFGSFGTPTSWRNNDMDEVVTAASGRLKGYDLKTGVERWSIEGVTGYVCTTPVVAEGRLYFGAWSNAAVENNVPPWVEFLKMFDKNGDGEVAFDEIDVSQRDYWRGLDLNHDGKYTQEDWELRIARVARFQNVMVAVMPGGTGNITETHVAWTFGRGLPYVPSPLCYQGRIYMVKDGGLFTSLDAKTGKAFYTQERIGAAGSYYASPVAADGRIYLASLTGKLTVVAAGGTTPEVLHQVDFGGRIFATPALVGENLYLRTAARLWAFGKQ